MTVARSTRVYGQGADLLANVRRADTGVPLSGQDVNFFIDGKLMGSAKVDPLGHAAKLSLKFADVQQFQFGHHVSTAVHPGNSSFLPGLATSEYVVFKSQARILGMNAEGANGSW